MLIAKAMQEERYDDAQRILDGLPDRTVDKEERQAILYAREGKDEDAARDIARRPLIELMSAECAPERMRLGGRVARGGQAVLAAVLLAVVWGSCVFQPVYFIAFIIPMGFAACFATSLVARLGVATWGERARGRSGRYWDGLTAFTVRQVEARVSSTSMALVHDVFGLFLVAILAFALGAEGLFAIVAGVLAFTVGLIAVYALMTTRAVERVVLPRV